MEIYLIFEKNIDAFQCILLFFGILIFFLMNLIVWNRKQHINQLMLQSKETSFPLHLTIYWAIVPTKIVHGLTGDGGFFRRYV